jgi:hypothetical protein
MSPELTDEERELDRLWRERFGQPLPILGAPEVVREILGVPKVLRVERRRRTSEG